MGVVIGVALLALAVVALAGWLLCHRQIREIVRVRTSRVLRGREPEVGGPFRPVASNGLSEYATALVETINARGRAVYAQNNGTDLVEVDLILNNVRGMVSEYRNLQPTASATRLLEAGLEGASRGVAEVYQRAQDSGERDLEVWSLTLSGQFPKDDPALVLDGESDDLPLIDPTVTAPRPAPDAPKIGAGWRDPRPSLASFPPGEGMGRTISGNSRVEVIPAGSRVRTISGNAGVNVVEPGCIIEQISGNAVVYLVEGSTIGRISGNARVVRIIDSAVGVMSGAAEVMTPVRSSVEDVQGAARWG